MIGYLRRMMRSREFFIFAAFLLIFISCLIVFTVEPQGIFCYLIGLMNGWLIQEMSEVW